MMKRVYVCAPLGGNIEENLKKVKTYTAYALRCGTAAVVPHFYALCLDDNDPKDREIGMAAGMSLLWLCDEVWVFGDTVTDGMRAELKFCKNLNIRIRYITEKETHENPFLSSARGRPCVGILRDRICGRRCGRRNRKHLECCQGADSDCC